MLDSVLSPRRDSHGSTVDATINVDNGQDGVEDTGHTFTRDETGSDGESEQVERLRTLVLPNQSRGGTHAHGNGVVGLGNDKAETDSVPVGDVDVVLGRDPLVLGDDGEDGNDGEADSGHTGGQAYGELGGDDGESDSFPGGNGGGGEGALLGRGIDDAWVSLGEENEETGRDKDREERAEDLSPELVDGLSAEKVTSLQVTYHVDGVRSSRRSDGTGDQVFQHSRVASLALTTKSTTHDELGSLGDGTERIGVGGTGSLNTDKGEDESEDDGEDDVAEVHVELKRANKAGEDDGKEETTGPSPEGDLVLLLDRVGNCVFVNRDLLTGNLGVDLHDTGTDTLVESRTVHGELGERVGEHHEDTGPETPVTRRGGVERLLVRVEAHGEVVPSERLVRSAEAAIPVCLPVAWPVATMAGPIMAHMRKEPPRKE